MDYFDKYKEAKFCLYCMISQFFEYHLPIEEAEEFNIKYSKNIIKFDRIDVCYHDFDSEGLMAWDYLGIEKPFITYDEIWDSRRKLRDEEKNDDIDYYQMYLKLSILLIDLVTKYYRISITYEDANNADIPFDLTMDEFDGMISACHHNYETAGENVWSYFEIVDPIVGRSVFDKKRDEYCDKILELERSRVKKYK